MPTTDKLTDTKCRAAKPRERPYKMADGLGLALWVSPTGARVWRWYYRLAGKPKTMSLGQYPEVTLQQARQLRDEARAKLRAGADPMAPRRTVERMTLSQACAAYWAGRGDVSASYRSNAVRGLAMHVEPRLGSRPVHTLTRDDLLQVLTPMDAAGKLEYVRKVRMWLSLVLDWAVERGEAALNPAKLIDPRKAFGRRKVQHFAAVELNEVRPLLQRLALESMLQSAIACRLLALTWVRTNELRMMLWSEVDGDLWRIPAGKMKRKRDHLVPLSPQAVKLLQHMRDRATGSPYVFPNDRRKDRPMSENAVLYLLGRMGYAGRMTGHGWRTLASTWANEAGFPADAIERQLAHAPDDKVRAAYNRAEYLDIRRQMLCRWADWLDAQEADRSPPAAG